MARSRQEFPEGEGEADDVNSRSSENQPSITSREANLRPLQTTTLAFPTEEIVEDSAVHGEENDEQGPQHLVARRARASCELEQSEDVQHDDYHAAAA